ncbi:MAG: bifunctional glycosyltransferase family 2/GtrA family protein [Oscillospiraceae bacterium]|nr:bifunctional glycosyltransferase family 2/GtrA family protein [Oscillospiraceae bacterium]
MKHIALIPAYQPDKELIQVISGLAERNFMVITVDDGSGQAYESIFRLASVKSVVLTHEVNQGKGEALKTGIRYIMEQIKEPYLIVTADADGQHQIQDILNVCAEAEQHPESLVLGSRKFEGDVPLRSRFGNAVTRTVYRLCSGVSIYDTQTGLRAFTNQLTEKMLSVEGSRYEYEMNVLMYSAKTGIPIREVWISTVYLNENASSHFHAVRDSFRIYKEILKFSASSFISFLIDYGLFCLFSALTGKMMLSNVIARIFSSIVNYTLNKKLVFCSQEKTAESAVKYFLLAGVILLCNTLILKGFSLIGLNAYLAKILTEIILFVCSYLIQHKFIFRKGHVS